MWSTLRFKNRYNKNATAFSPSRGIIQLYLLNQKITIMVLKFRVLNIFNDFLAQFWSNLLRKLYTTLKLNGILITSYY